MPTAQPTAAEIQAGKALLPPDLLAALEATQTEMLAACSAARFATAVQQEVLLAGDDTAALDAERVRLVRRFEEVAGRMEGLIAEGKTWIARTFSVSPPLHT